MARNKTDYHVLFMLIAMLVIGNSCEIFEGPCADADLGYLYLMTDLADISPYTEDLLIYFKDSLENEVTFEFISENVSHSIEGYSTANVPCESNSSKRKEYKAINENYQFSINESQASLELSFHCTYGVNLGYLNSIMVADMLEIWISTQFGNNNTSGTGYGGYGGFSIGGFRHITNPRECTDEYLTNFPQPQSGLKLLDKTFQEVYVSLDSTIYYNYEFGIIAFRDGDNKLWVLERIESIN